MPTSAAMRMRKLFGKVGGFFKNNQRRNKEAAQMMDKKHPSGWSQSPTMIQELKQIKKGIK